jgi:single-stranded-DNA-specific exonuclease
MPKAIWQILAARGCRSMADVEKLIDPKLKDLAHPYTIDGMATAVERLLKALDNNEKILIYGDYDLDGTPGLALLADGLNRLGFKGVELFQPSRLKDGYGFHAARAGEFVEKGVSLIVTVDVGITDIETVDELKSIGVDVIITDHHLPKEKCPEAIAILNPNKGHCTSRLQHLCGAGVAFYLVLALRMELNRLGRLKKDFNPKDLLDLFALATITDMVPLVNENRVLVKHGLKALAQTERPGLRGLLQSLNLYRKSLRAQDVGFRIAPKLNALTRLDEGLTALQVLTASESEAQKLVDEVLLVNQRRSALQKQAKSIVEEWLEQQKGLDSKKMTHVFVCHPEFHPGVVSLIASDLSNRFNVPALVGAIRPDGRVAGSARAPNKTFNLQTILKSAEGVLEKFGGHQLAAGFEVHHENIGELQRCLEQHFERAEMQSEAQAESEPPVLYDADLELSDITPEFMTWFENLGPFGMQFEAPLFAIRKLKVLQRRVLKGEYLKYTLTDGVTKIDALWFSKPKEFQEGSEIDVLGEPQWNEFMGQRSLQLLLTDASMTRRVKEGMVKASHEEKSRLQIVENQI